MMSPALPLTLTREQARRLHCYAQTYRHYAYACLPPSEKRNMTLRILQGMQGKLVAALDQCTALLTCSLTAEEFATVKKITEELRLLYFQEPETTERNAIMDDLEALKQMLERSEEGGSERCFTFS